MAVLISDELLNAFQLDERKIRIEIACILYDKGILSLAQAASMAALDRISFQKELSQREIFIKYSVEDLEEDLNTLANLRKNDSSK